MNICKIFDSNITYVEYARSGVEYYTESLEETRELVKNGWKYHKTSKGFRVIPPEVSIVDLTDYNRAIQYQNLYFNYIYYLFLKRLLKNNKLNNYINEILEKNKLKYKSFKFLISIGPVLDSEIRIVGSDKRIDILKMDMLEKFINSTYYEDIIENYYDEMEEYSELESYKISLEEKSGIEKEFYNDLSKQIGFLSDKKVYNENIFKIYNIEKLKKENIDVIVFLPFGCFKYLSSFVTANNVKKIMFWEIHADDSKESTFRLYSKSLKGKKVLVIDNMYSGKTMKLMRKIIVERGGIPVILGLNPKNVNNIKIADYIMVLNTIYKSDELDTSIDDLFEKKYISTLKGDKNEKN